MNWNERLTQARIAKGIKKSAFAKALGISPSAVTQWESGAINKLEGANLIAACAALDITPEWLLHGSGGASSSNTVISATLPGAMRVVIDDPSNPDFYHIKKVKLQLRAGVTGFQTVPDIYDGDTISLRKNWVDRKDINPATLLALTVAGESMEPNLYAGDIVIIDTADKAMRDGSVYAFNYDGEAVIKRLVKERGDWWLFSDNPDQARHRPKGCRSADCGIVGRVVKRETDHI